MIVNGYPSGVPGAVTREWVNRYSGTAEMSLDGAYAMALDSQGNIYVTGKSRDPVNREDFVTIKYYPDGAQRWVRRYDGPAHGYDTVSAIAVDANDNIYVTGYSTALGGDYDFTTIKYNSNGQRLWTRHYNGPTDDDDYPQAIAVDGQGNVFVTGYSEVSDGYSSNYCFVTIKYNTDGVRQWVKRYYGPDYESYAYAIAVDSQGNAYVTGESYGLNYSDYCTIKYDPNGNALWLKRYNGPGNSYDCPYAIALDSQGNVYVTGYSTGSGTGSDYATVKYNSAGQGQWVKRYNGPGNGADTATEMKVDGEDNIIVTGYSDADFFTIKYNSAGQGQWARRYGPAGAPNALAVDGAGNVYVAGYYVDSSAENYLVIKYSPDGQRLWGRGYNGTADGPDRPWGAAVDGQGNVYVTGFSAGAATDYGYDMDIVTIKYSQPPAP